MRRKNSCKYRCFATDAIRYVVGVKIKQEIVKAVTLHFR